MKLISYIAVVLSSCVLLPDVSVDASPCCGLGVAVAGTLAFAGVSAQKGLCISIFFPYDFPVAVGMLGFMYGYMSVWKPTGAASHCLLPISGCSGRQAPPQPPSRGRLSFLRLRRLRQLLRLVRRKLRQKAQEGCRILE